MAIPQLSVSRIIPLALLASTILCQAQTSLTVYNQGFAVVRERLPLDLREGVNDVRFAGVTARLEPDSVILRDPAGGTDLRILEQNYRADPVSEGLLLSLNEGKTIEFLVPASGADPSRVVEGRIVRSGYRPGAAGNSSDGYNYSQNQNPNQQPLIEVKGQLQFGLPGTPRFPSLPDDTVLKPTLVWKLHSEKPAKLDAEVGYLTNGMGWDAAYNIVAPEKGDTLDLTGWVTIQNQSGKTFTDAGIQLMAGDVSKLREQARRRGYLMEESTPFVGSSNTLYGQATEKPFEDYHLYTLPLPSTLRDGETKQVEFVKAAGVASSKLFVYDGVKIDRSRWGNGGMEAYRNQAEFGTESNTKVAVMREFKNSRENHLGIPLPKGTMRFYRRDTEGRLQFVGENLIDHTAADETVRINTGNAFDLVGDRKRTSYKQDGSAQQWFDETFEISLRNHQREDVEIRVVEHLYRWTNWEITESSNTFLKTDAQTIEFRAPLKPDEERKVTYTVHYSW